MPPTTQTLTVPGAMLERGFWLYVWRVETPKGQYLYVGRTGDSSSAHATPPYQRMGQHLGHQKTQNMLRTHLENKCIKPEECKTFQLIAHGPLFPEAPDYEAHKKPRNIVAALEKSLADSLKESGYEVLNTVKCRFSLDQKLWIAVRAAFAKYFPKLEPKS
jgi:hypothetical protein